MHQSHSLSSALLGSLFCYKMYSLPEHYTRCHRESAALSLSLFKQEQPKDSAENTHKQFFALLPKEEKPGSSLPKLFMGQHRTFGCALFQATGLNNRNFVGHRKFNIFVFCSCLCTLGINSSSHTAASGMRPFCSLHVTTQQRGLKHTPYLHKSVTCSIWKKTYFCFLLLGSPQVQWASENRGAYLSVWWKSNSACSPSAFKQHSCAVAGPWWECSR